MSLEEERFDFSNNEEYDEDLNENTEEEEYFHDDFYNQSLEDLTINIKIKFEDYLNSQGFNFKIPSYKFVNLLEN